MIQILGIIRGTVSQSSPKPFVFMGPDHITVIGLTILIATLLPVIIRLRRSPRTEWTICWTLAGILILGELSSYVYIISQDGWSSLIQYGLPLHACGIAVYLTALMLITRKQILFEIAYFWGFAGTTQAILTPVVQVGFPSIQFIQFFLMHGCIITGVSVALFGLRMRPRLKGLWITYALSWLLVFVIGGANALLDSNYMYLCRPPAGKSPFYFLPWPWYIAFLGIFALILFFLLWLPFSRTTPKHDKTQ